MKELDYIFKQIQEDFENDETITTEDKMFIKGKLLGRKYKMEEEIKQHKKYVCKECNSLGCNKSEEQILHCVVNWE